MSSYREQCLKAKAVREGVIEARPAGSRNAKPRPIVVESRWIGSGISRDRAWSKWRAYRSEAEAQAAISNAGRKYGFLEFRLRPTSPLPLQEPR